MSTEAELAGIERAVSRQAEAMEALTQALYQMAEVNQRILEVLIEVAVPDDPDNQPLRDMEGNPV